MYMQNTKNLRPLANRQPHKLIDVGNAHCKLIIWTHTNLAQAKDLVAQNGLSSAFQMPFLNVTHNKM